MEIINVFDYNVQWWYFDIEVRWMIKILLFFFIIIIIIYLRNGRSLTKKYIYIKQLLLDYLFFVGNVKKKGNSLEFLICIYIFYFIYFVTYYHHIIHIINKNISGFILFSIIIIIIIINIDIIILIISSSLSLSLSLSSIIILLLLSLL